MLRMDDGLGRVYGPASPSGKRFLGLRSWRRPRERDAQEVNRRALEARGHDNDVGLQLDLLAVVTGLGLACALVEADAVGREAERVAAQVLGLAGSDVLEEFAVEARRALEDALPRRREILEVADSSAPVTRWPHR